MKAGSWDAGAGRTGTAANPALATEGRAGASWGLMSCRIGWVCLLGLAAAGPLAAQNQMTSVSGALRPALAQVGQAVAGAQPDHWKMPREVKSATDGDIEAIQRDLNGTLAGLLQQADAAPGEVPAEFVVYRNVDALYDTLLRVVETADLAAPDEEAEALQNALVSLENARGELGDRILAGAQSQQTQLTGLRNAIQAAEAARRTPVRTTVVNDYGRRREVHHYTRRVVHHPPHKAAAKPKPKAAEPGKTEPQ